MNVYKKVVVSFMCVGVCAHVCMCVCLYVMAGQCVSESSSLDHVLVIQRGLDHIHGLG